ncbi:MAG: right-handed parallel beta-helix repeat-containing protein [Nitrospirota bacterium]|nr:right-handed parallel beta-helix repeat-containing protein [Nitrospirota bacterium]
MISYTMHTSSAHSNSENIDDGQDVPLNSLGGRTLIVDQSNSCFYPRPSAALKDAGPQDLIYIRPGQYEDRLFVSERPIQIAGAGRDQVQIFSRRSGPLYLQKVPSGQISGITFRYVGSDQHSAVNILDSTCNISQCRATEGILSGIVIYGQECKPTLNDNEVCNNRESGIFTFAGARPYLTKNTCFDNHHFGLAVRDDGSQPDLIKNICRHNMLSGILLFHGAKALLLENICEQNFHWGIVMTPDSKSSPEQEQLLQANTLTNNPRGSLIITHEPLGEIGR